MGVYTVKPGHTSILSNDWLTGQEGTWQAVRSRSGRKRPGCGGWEPKGHGIPLLYLDKLDRDARARGGTVYADGVANVYALRTAS